MSHVLNWFDYCFLQELCRQAKVEYAEETRKAQELHDKIKAEISEAKYNKHYNICWEVRSVTGDHKNEYLVLWFLVQWVYSMN